MKTEREPGMSLLDYLWKWFGGYTPSDTIDNPVDPDKLVTQKALEEFIAAYNNDAICELKVIPIDSTKVQLLGLDSEGTPVSMVELDKGIGLDNVQLIESTQEHIDEGICSKTKLPLLKFIKSDDTCLYVDLSRFVYTAGETRAIKNTITNNKIFSELKIDRSMNDAGVEVKLTDDGLKIYAKVNDSGKQIYLTRTVNGLDAHLKWAVEGKDILFKQLTMDQYLTLSRPVEGTIYFITDELHIFLNGIKYSSGSAGSLVWINYDE